MNEPIDRRSFGRDLAVTAAATLTAVGGYAARADDAQTVAPADQLLALLKGQFPDRLSDEQWKEVRGKIAGQLRSAEELRKFSLRNSDEPVTVFAAYRKS